MYYMRLSMLAPTPPRGGEASWGFYLIRIQLPHPPGKIQIQIPPSYTGHIRRVTGDLTRQVYEWHEPVRRNRRVRRRECHDTVVIADGDKTFSSPYVFNKIATSRGPTQKRGTRVSTVKQSTRVQTQRDAR